MKLNKEQLRERKEIFRFLEGADAKLVAFCDEEPICKKKGILTYPYVNAMMCQWCMPVSWEPPMICFSVGKERFSHNLLSLGRNVVVSHVPRERYEAAVQEFGKKTGWDGKKANPSDYFGLTYGGQICQLSDVGDHTLVTYWVDDITLYHND